MKKVPRLLAIMALVLLILAVTAVRGQSALDGFDPNANDKIRVVVQPDGRILLGGDFAALSSNDGTTATRNYIARLPTAGLTFADRVVYQRAIEEVYWRHRKWTRSGGENVGPKPPLDTIVSQRQIEQKVEEYLRKAELVADRRGSPITGGELQTEMERMASRSRQPEVLRELFAALGNDPFVIAECLVRPILAEQLVTSLRADGGAKALAGSSAFTSETYKLPEISSLECADNWTPTTLVNAPTARAFHTAVWTGSEMIVWGGNTGGSDSNSGARYNPSTDSWTATSTTNAPTARQEHTAVWTGSEMIVWGGTGPGCPQTCNTGGRYNPTADSWTATSPGAPADRYQHSAVWAGSEMIVWGGARVGGVLNSGGRYNPSTDGWAATTDNNAPDARYFHTAVWTGSEMIVWGGRTPANVYFNTGGRYDPGTNSWTATSTSNVPVRANHTAVWTGSEMIVWGGTGNTGGKYNPTTDSWTVTSTTNAPAARSQHTAVWTGSQMIVWGGWAGGSSYLNTGARYDPGIDNWGATSTTNAPTAREDQTQCGPAAK